MDTRVFFFLSSVEMWSVLYVRRKLTFWRSIISSDVQWVNTGSNKENCYPSKRFQWLLRAWTWSCRVLVTATFESMKPFPQYWDCGKLNCLQNSCMQIFGRRGNSIQWWWICLCYWKPAARVYWAISWLQATQWHFPAVCRLFSAKVESDSSMLQIEALQCNSELKTTFRDAQEEADKTGVSQRAVSIIPRAVQRFQSCNVPFWKHVYAWKKCSLEWTLIKASTGQGWQMDISRLYSEF